MDISSIIKSHDCPWCGAQPGLCQCKEELEARIAAELAKRQKWDIRHDRYGSRIFASFELWDGGIMRGSVHQQLGSWVWYALSPEGEVIGKGEGHYHKALQAAWDCYQASKQAEQPQEQEESHGIACFTVGCSQEDCYWRNGEHL